MNAAAIGSSAARASVTVSLVPGLRLRPLGAWQPERADVRVDASVPGGHTSQHWLQRHRSRVRIEGTHDNLTSSDCRHAPLVCSRSIRTSPFGTGAACAVVMVSIVLSLVLSACGKSPSESARRALAGTAGTPDKPHHQSGGKPILTKEEVAAVLGHPVTEVEGSGTSLTYKTDVIGLETDIEVEEVQDAAGEMDSARTATGLLGGKPEDVPNLGDEAFFGAMSLLYVRKGSSFITITPPNLQMAAGMAALAHVQNAPMGSVEQANAVEDLKKVEKTDPLNAGLSGGSPMQGAVAVVAASSKKQGTTYESDARKMSLALAAKLLAKL